MDKTTKPTIDDIIKDIVEEGMRDIFDREGDFDDVYIYKVSEQTLESLNEGRTIRVASGLSMRIDQPTHLHGAGQSHTHLYGRKGGQIGVINMDGSASHGVGFRLNKEFVKPLNDLGYKVPSDRWVEWALLDGDMGDIFLG